MRNIAEDLILTMYKNQCNSLLAFLITAKDEVDYVYRNQPESDSQTSRGLCDKSDIHTRE